MTLIKIINKLNYHNIKFGKYNKISVVAKKQRYYKKQKNISFKSNMAVYFSMSLFFVNYSDQLLIYNNLFFYIY